MRVQSRCMESCDGIRGSVCSVFVFFHLFQMYCFSAAAGCAVASFATRLAMSNGQLIHELETKLEAGDLTACCELLSWEDWRVKDEFYIPAEQDSKDDVCVIWHAPRCPWSEKCNKQAYGRKHKMVSRRCPEEVLEKLRAHGMVGGYHEFCAEVAQQHIDSLDIEATITSYEESYNERQRYSSSVSCAHHRVA